MTARQWMVLGVLLVGGSHLAWGVETLAGIFTDSGANLPANVVVGDWGAIPREDDAADPFKPQAVLPGAGYYGLRVTTLGRYQGMRIDLKQPIDASTVFGQKNRYLEVYLRGVKGDTLPAMGRLRFTLYTDKGTCFISAKESEFFPKDTVNSVWTRIGIPISVLTPQMPPSAKIRRVIITTDTPADFFLGRLAFVNDSTPITINPSVLPLPVAGRQVNFRSGAYSGLARHETVWDFDAAAGTSVDAMGDSVTQTFNYLSTYKVTVTVTDPSGWKEPQTATISVKVNRK